MGAKGKEPIRVSSELSDEMEEGPGGGGKSLIISAIPLEGTKLMHSKEIGSP